MSDIIEQKVINVDIESEMKKSYIDYAMSVIASRALPDVRDGLKPVHRRILYAMYDAGYTPDKPYRKSAATVGDVLKRFHPHGDAAVYDSMVRMAQDFSLRYRLIDGQGNFGSVDGDPPAAMRYTESRISKMSLEMLREIEKNTVDFIPNYDEQDLQPSVLPSRFPNLLVNGSSGIAVGMATNIPPHNLGEVIDGVIQVIDDPHITIEELIKYIKGPDFPTAGLIVGKEGIREAYTTGRGKVTMRAAAEIEPMGTNRQRIVVTEIPYQVNKARLIEKIADLVRDKRIEGISDLRDESDREGMRIVIELKRDANGNVVLNQLYKNTQMQETFGVNMLALVGTQPCVLNLRSIIDHYLDHQKEVIVRRTKFDLEKAEARAHILEGLRIAMDNIDRIISLIRASKTVNEAKEGLMVQFGLSDKQAQAILEMRLQRLTGLERDKIEQEYSEVLARIKYFREILGNDELVLQIIKDELLEIKTRFGDPRRTQIIPAEGEIDLDDLIHEEESIITLTHYGYIKRVPSDTYKSQKRGGKGILALSTKEEDFVKNLFSTSTHDYLMFFTNKGRVYRLKAYEIPEAGRQAKGTAIVNLLQLMPDEKVMTVIPVREFKEGLYLLMATRDGIIKKTDLMEFENIRKGGLIALNIMENDELIDVKLTEENMDLIFVTANGMSIRVNESSVRPMGRTARGVKSMKLDEDDYIIGMEAFLPDKTELLAVTANGFGKRTEIDEYRTQSRNGKGILTYRVTEKTGKITGIALVNDKDDVMLINSDGTIIRLHACDISILGRTTQGVTLMRVGEGVTIMSIAIVVKEDTDEGEENDLEGSVDVASTPEE